MPSLQREEGLGLLTVGVVLLPDTIHPPVRVNPQEVASVFTVQPLGIFKVSWGKATATAVIRSGRKCGDLARGHVLLSLSLSLSPSPAGQIRSRSSAGLPLAVSPSSSCSQLPEPDSA